MFFGRTLVVYYENTSQAKPLGLGDMALKIISNVDMKKEGYQTILFVLTIAFTP